MPVSKKDTLRVSLGNKRVEAFKEAMLVPAKAIKRCQGIVFASGQEKSIEVINPKGLVIESAIGKMRSSADKLGRESREHSDKYQRTVDYHYGETGGIIVSHTVQQVGHGYDMGYGVIGGIIATKRSKPYTVQEVGAKKKGMSRFLANKVFDKASESV